MLVFLPPSTPTPTPLIDVCSNFLFEMFMLALVDVNPSLVITILLWTVSHRCWYPPPFCKPDIWRVFGTRVLRVPTGLDLSIYCTFGIDVLRSSPSIGPIYLLYFWNWCIEELPRYWAQPAHLFVVLLMSVSTLSMLFLISLLGWLYFFCGAVKVSDVSFCRCYLGFSC